MVETLRKNQVRIVVIAILLLLFLSASMSMDGKDWVITVLRGLSVGAIVFLVASGFSLIFGLMDVLNLAHGELFMVGAYIGWTIYVRPDTFVDGITPLALLAAGLVLMPVFFVLAGRLRGGETAVSILPWVFLILSLVILYFSFTQWPLAMWDPEVFQESPATYALAVSQGNLQIPEAATAEGLPPIVLMLGMLLGGVLLALAVVGLRTMRKTAVTANRINKTPIILSGVLILIGFAAFVGNNALSAWMFSLNTTSLFFVALIVATLVGGMIGGLVESTLIRPLYDRPIYQIMLTLGVSFIGIELVRAVWGRPEFTMPKPALFSGTGDGCPATNLPDLIANKCSTIMLLDARVRTYNEIFVILVGLFVLISVWLILKRTRLGMIIRAGVQDSEMVEAMGINVRRVFTLVFALGVGLAALGGVLAAPSIGLSNSMGARYLLMALIALAIGGLTSYPGAAAGAVLVGLMQQFMIKYGQIGINLPFLAEPFKPSPPLVPASTVILMVIILLILPYGLFGSEE
jgi:branched-chain amino acid transport system permease protein